jgi:hypothetical protein
LFSTIASASIHDHGCEHGNGTQQSDGGAKDRPGLFAVSRDCRDRRHLARREIRPVVTKASQVDRDQGQDAGLAATPADDKRRFLQ